MKETAEGQEEVERWKWRGEKRRVATDKNSINHFQLGATLFSPINLRVTRLRAQSTRMTQTMSG